MRGNLPRLEAEVATWPLHSEVAFSRAMVSLRRSGPGSLETETQALAEELEGYLRLRADGGSIESLRLLTDGVWFGMPVANEGLGRSVLTLTSYVLKVARRHAALTGSAACLVGTAEHRVEVQAERWRWLTFAQPPDLTVASLAAEAGIDAPCDRVTLAIPALDELLREHDVAQTHEHLGAALSFAAVWSNLMARVAFDPPARDDFRSSAAVVPFGSWDAFARWLPVAALARLTLGSFLWNRERGRSGDLSAFLATELPGRRETDWHSMALRSLLEGRSPPPIRAVATAYRRYWNPGRVRWPPRTPAEGRGLDPLSRWLGASGAALPETRFLSRALRYLTVWHDEVFERMFWQYVRVRTRTHRFLNQEPGTAGLDWFFEHFQRIAGLRRGLDGVRMALAAEIQVPGVRLRSLEVRTAPEPSWVKVRDLVREVRDTPAPPSVDAEMERGLVLHFIKERGGRNGRPLNHCDPRQAAFGCRYGAYFYARLREALAIEAALRHHPELLTVLRGLDVCSLELAVPNWVIFPLFRRLRAASVRSAAAIGDGRAIRPLQITMHAGEDFRHLSEGLRRLHEPIEYGVVRSGDRLGHAVALGIDVDEWAARHPSVLQPAEERLQDLLWEAAVVARGGMETSTARMAYLSATIGRLAERIFGREVSQNSLSTLRRQIHEPDFLEGLGFPFMRRAAVISGAGDLVFQFLTDAAVYLRGQENVEVLVDERERIAMRDTQRFVQREAGDLGLTVESNPSSNLLIGSIPHHALPAFRLQPLSGSGDGPIVPVAFGDDDPITFSSCLADEYGYVFHALTRRGVSAFRALEWLDIVRNNGWQARFTLPESIRKQGHPRQKG